MLLLHVMSTEFIYIVKFITSYIIYISLYPYTVILYCLCYVLKFIAVLYYSKALKYKKVN